MYFFFHFALRLGKTFQIYNFALSLQLLTNSEHLKHYIGCMDFKFKSWVWKRCLMQYSKTYNYKINNGHQPSNIYVCIITNKFIILLTTSQWNQARKTLAKSNLIPKTYMHNQSSCTDTPNIQLLNLNSSSSIFVRASSISPQVSLQVL